MRARAERKENSTEIKENKVVLKVAKTILKQIACYLTHKLEEFF